jgi:hypothetical protein
MLGMPHDVPGLRADAAMRLGGGTLKKLTVYYLERGFLGRRTKIKM